MTGSNQHIERYRWEADSMYSDTEGRFIEWDEYARLLEQLEVSQRERDANMAEALRWASKATDLEEQYESLRVAGQDVVTAWQYGRRSMREAVTNLAVAVEDSNPAKEYDGGQVVPDVLKPGDLGEPTRMATHYPGEPDPATAPKGYEMGSFFVQEFPPYPASEGVSGQSAVHPGSASSGESSPAMSRPEWATGEACVSKCVFCESKNVWEIGRSAWKCADCGAGGPGVMVRATPNQESEQKG